MNKLLTLLLLFPISLTAQVKYFHELKGMEDSTGTTHLFYRTFESIETSCSYFEYVTTYNLVENSVYQLNTKNLFEFKKLIETRGYTVDCGTPWVNLVENYSLLDDDPDSVLVIRFAGGGHSLGNYLHTGIYNSFDLGLGNPNGIIKDKFTGKIILNTPIYHLLVKTNENYFDLEKYLKKSFFFSPPDNASEDYRGYFDVPDSLLIDFIITGSNPYHKGTYVGLKDTSIVISTDFGKTFTRIAKSPFEIWELAEYLRLNESTFDGDSSSFYLHPKGEHPFLVRKINEEWEVIELENVANLTANIDNSGTFYYSNGDSLFYTSNFGLQKQVFLTFSFEITGLYKKPNSDILYVLTTDELFEVNTETKAVTSLKKLPVSNEEPKETPSSIKLYQNYPNPFNPSTTISFELDRPAEVTLTIFDALGKVVLVLVNEQRTTGLHEISFDASSLSSGIYFYRLESGAFSETKRFTLIK